uniref:Uncharacterized protein n=1 Tax=Cannabis sativa TaxID=3483 RepID=A0A803PRY2_CANSA
MTPEASSGLALPRVEDSANTEPRQLLEGHIQDTRPEKLTFASDDDVSMRQSSVGDSEEVKEAITVITTEEALKAVKADEQWLKDWRRQFLEGLSKAEELSICFKDVMSNEGAQGASTSVPMESSRGDNSDYDGPVVINKKRASSSNNGTNKKARVETKEKMSNERIELPPLPLEPFTLPIRPLRLMEGNNAFLEAMDQFYQKRHCCEVEEMRKLSTSISYRCNAEFANYGTWNKAAPPLINRVELAERLHPHVSDIHGKLPEAQANVIGLMAERNCSLLVQQAYDLEVLKAEQANIERRREEVERASTKANTKMDDIIRQRVSKSLDRSLAREMKATKTEKKRRDMYKDLHSKALTCIKDFEVDKVEAAEADAVKKAKEAERKLVPATKAPEESQKRITYLKGKSSHLKRRL